jgi:hypothetical protein
MTFRRRVLARYQVVSDFKTSLTRFVGQGHPGDKVDHVLKAFKRLRDQQKIKDAKQKDIDQWKDFEALEKFVAKLDSESTVSRKLGEKTDGAELIAENEGWRVYKILNHQACMRYGDDTQWCIKKPDGQQWREYTEEHDFYFFIAKLRPATDRWFKIAMMVDHGGQRLYWDAEDEPREGAAKVPAALKLPTIKVENAQPKIMINVNGQWVPLDQFALMEGLTVKGDLNLHYTQVKQLPAGLTVGGNLDLSDTPIKLLPADLTVKGDLDLSDTPIKLLPADLTVKGNLDLGGSKIKQLPAGLTVGGNLNLRDTQIKLLPAGLKVGGDLDLSRTPIKQLPAGLTVGGDLDLGGTPIKQLPAGLKVGGGLNLRGTPIKQLPAGLTVGGNLDLGGTPIELLPAGLTVGGNLDLGGSKIKQLPPDLKVKGQIYADPGLDPGKFKRQVVYD